MQPPLDERRQAVFKKGVDALREAGIENPALDAAVLLGYVTGEPPESVLLERDRTVDPSARALYSTLISRRCGRAAVSRLIGSREFFSRKFSITPEVLDPRPETELLVEEAVRFLEGREGALRVLDVGTGSGVIAVTVALELPLARVTATDISLPALAVARRNATLHAVRDRVDFIQTDLTSGVRGGGLFDAVLSNPPYISLRDFDSLPEEVRSGDPMQALVSGDAGTEHYPVLAQRSLALLAGGGCLMVEVGAGQAGDVARILTRAGFEEVATVNDLAGHGRVVKGIRKNA